MPEILILVKRIVVLGTVKILNYLGIDRKILNFTESVMPCHSVDANLDKHYTSLLFCLQKVFCYKGLSFESDSLKNS
jgi:hypothetical protein